MPRTPKNTTPRSGRDEARAEAAHRASIERQRQEAVAERAAQAAAAAADAAPPAAEDAPASAGYADVLRRMNLGTFEDPPEDSPEDPPEGPPVLEEISEVDDDDDDADDGRSLGEADYNPDEVDAVVAQSAGNAAAEDAALAAAAAARIKAEADAKRAAALKEAEIRAKAAAAAKGKRPSRAADAVFAQLAGDKNEMDESAIAASGVMFETKADLEVKRQAGDAMKTAVKKLFGADVGDGAAQILYENLNGANLAGDGAVAFGYIDPAHYLYIPASQLQNVPQFSPREGRIPPLTPSAKLPLAFIEMWALNVRMIAGEKDVTKMMVLTAFVKVYAAWTVGITLSPAERAVDIDEYRVVSDPASKSAKALAAIVEAKTARAFEATLGRIRTNIHRVLGTVVHVFRARNHHYKGVAQFLEFLNRTYEAVWNGEPDMFGMEAEDLFRNSVHCLGMFPLVEYMKRCKDAGKMPAALVIRQSVARAGTARVLVASAVIEVMRGDLIWADVADLIQPLARPIDAEATRVRLLEDMAHTNAGYMTGIQRTADTTPNETVITPLIAIIKGYLTSLTSKSTIKKQVTLDKAGQNYSGAIEAYADAFTKARDEKSKVGLREMIRMHLARPGS